MSKPKYVMKNPHKLRIRTYECDEYTVDAIEETCFFCKHCTDIFYDYTNGPYWFQCSNCNEIITYPSCDKFEE